MTAYEDLRKTYRIMKDDSTMLKNAKQKKNKRRYEGEPKSFFPKITFHIRRKQKKFVMKLVAKNPTFFDEDQGHNAWKSLLKYLFRNYSPEITSMPITSYSKNAKLIMAFTEKTAYYRSFPKAPGQGKRLEGLEKIEPLNAWLFNDATVFPCSSSVVASKQINVPSLYVTHQKATITDGRFLLSQSDNNIGTLYFPKPVQQDVGVMLFGSGAANWYHWLIEILPAGFLSQNLPDEYANYPLLIPEEVYGHSNFRESLELFRNGRTVKLLSKGTHCFERLIVIDCPVIEPMNMLPGCWPTPKDYSYNPEILLKYRDSIINAFGVKECAGNERIFLARRHGRRSYNQNEVLEIAKKYGFRDVYLEEMSFREQVDLLIRSSFIVGPSGAAFANTLFCRRGARLLSWLLPEYKGFCSYANISTTVGSDLRYIYGVSKAEISGTVEAYNAEYVVDVAEFENSLQLMIDDPNY